MKGHFCVCICCHVYLFFRLKDYIACKLPHPYFSVLDFHRLLGRCSCEELLGLRIFFWLLCEIVKTKKKVCVWGAFCSCFSVFYRCVFIRSIFCLQLHTSTLSCVGRPVRFSLIILPFYTAFQDQLPPLSGPHPLSEASLSFLPSRFLFHLL